jgi:hypothetical protein
MEIREVQVGMFSMDVRDPFAKFVDSFITPSRNLVEVRWRSLFRSTSLGKRCTSYNAPPTSGKRGADRWSLLNFLPRSSLFMVGKAQKSLKKVDRWNRIRTSAIQSSSRPIRFLRNFRRIGIMYTLLEAPGCNQLPEEGRLRTLSASYLYPFT